MDSNKQLKGKRKSMQRENGDGCHSSKHMSNDKDDTSYVQHMQLIPGPAYSPDMSPIEYVGNLVGRRLAHDPRPAASKDEL
ncbi:hypothetical protein TNCV_4174401 [Trichonephila clavipes]|nr:hypothetical protein TNCV_4174401 [Trichonephila clavipes]